MISRGGVVVCLLLRLFTSYLSELGEESTLIELLCHTHGVITVTDFMYKN